MTAVARPGVPGFVVWGRVLLLVLAAGALVAAIVQALPGHAAAATNRRYVCPMHPAIVSAIAGECPICHMALVPDRAASQEAAARGEEFTALVERRLVAEQVRAAASVGADGDGTAVLYTDDLVGLGPSEPATFFGRASPNMGISAHLRLGQSSPVDASTVRVHFHLDDPAAAGSLGADAPLDVGSLQIAPRARPLLVVPRSALLYSARGPYVLAASRPGGEFARRDVRVGRILDAGYVGGLAGSEQGAVVILTGLDEGERVITGYTFFVDAERRLHEGDARAEGHDR